MNVHVVLRVEAAKVDTREAGVQVGGETMADVTDTCLCLREKKKKKTFKMAIRVTLKWNDLTTFSNILVSMVLHYMSSTVQRSVFVVEMHCMAGLLTPGRSRKTVLVINKRMFKCSRWLGNFLDLWYHQLPWKQNHAQKRVDKKIQWEWLVGVSHWLTVVSHWLTITFHCSSYTISHLWKL